MAVPGDFEDDAPLPPPPFATEGNETSSFVDLHSTTEELGAAETSFEQPSASIVSPPHAQSLDDETSHSTETFSPDIPSKVTTSVNNSPTTSSTIDQADVDLLIKLMLERGNLEQTIVSLSHTVENLNDRIEELQGDQVNALLKPAATEIYRVLSQVDRWCSQVELTGSIKPDKRFDFIIDGLIEALEALGLNEIPVYIGDAFNKKIHHGSQTIETDDVMKDKTIAQVLQRAFSFTNAGKTAFPASVAVYAYKAN